jgi:2-hydroxychromene-2-carboxylate isomerase
MGRARPRPLRHRRPRAVAEDAGLSGEELRAAIESPAVKDELRAATARAWEVGVRGVPTVRVGARLFYGDDQLDAAAACVRS